MRRTARRGQGAAEMVPCELQRVASPRLMGHACQPRVVAPNLENRPWIALRTFSSSGCSVRNNAPLVRLHWTDQDRAAAAAD